MPKSFLPYFFTDISLEPRTVTDTWLRVNKYFCLSKLIEVLFLNTEFVEYSQNVKQEGSKRSNTHLLEALEVGGGATVFKRE